MFEDMGTSLPQMEAYQRIFKGARRMEEQLARFYHHYISFCISTIRFLSSRKRCWAIIRLSWGKERELFTSTITQLNCCKAEIETEAGVAHYEVSAKRHEELIRLYSSGQRAPVEFVKLPCRCIAFAKNPHFFRRSDISDQIEEHFTSKGFLSFVLYGLGGVGKTQIVQDFAYRHWDDYQVILWVTANTKNKIAKEYSDMAHNLGVSSTQDQSTSRRALKRWLETTGALYVCYRAIVKLMRWNLRQEVAACVR